MAGSQSIKLTDAPATGGPFAVFEGSKKPEAETTTSNGALKIVHPDGSVTIDFEPELKSTRSSKGKFGDNLAFDMSDDELATIATDLMDGVERDELSRKDWLETRAKGISLLGLKLKTPKSDLGSNIEGISSIDHPLILEATVAFQATARAELIPATGPVKVRNDSPPKPPQAELQDTSVQHDLLGSLAVNDDLANALEKDMNHYLTVTATEYVPDTDRMLFNIGWGGDGFKKVYNCPLRRRVVSESIDAEDLIISNYATDLRSCGRVTHRIQMRPSILKRMQIMGVYRDIDLALPQAKKENIVQKKKEEVSGVKNSYRRQQDQDYELLESYCELDIDRFAPKKFRGKGLPLPYRVTIERESRKILDVRRNWREDDDECTQKQYFVQFPFIRGLGFYGLGYVHLLGNVNITLTAAWRETIDAGMFASFPGFIYKKQIGRQLTNNFRIAPGSGVGVEVGPQDKLSDAIMPVPYRGVGGEFVGFISHVEEVGRRLAASGNIAVGEGKQEAPVGTTLALIEQATKVIDSAHKRLHAAQAEEFGLMKERFMEDPEAFWRFNKSPTMNWEKDQFIKAISSNNLVPVADPNNPTSLHRIAKATIIKELQKGSPEIYDKMAVDMKVFQIAGIDPSGLFKAKEDPAPPDPRMEAIKEKAKASQTQAQIQLQDSQLRHQTEMVKIADREKDRQSRERLEALRMEIAQTKMYTEGIEKNQTAYADAKAKEQEIYERYAKEQLQMLLDDEREHRKLDVEEQREKLKTEHEAARHILSSHVDDVKHQRQVDADERKTAAKLAADKEVAEMKLREASRKAAAKSKAKKDK